MLTKSELLELLRAHRVRLKKRLGQHHLIDPRLAIRLVASCGLAQGDTAIEIGAGLGALTELFAAKVKHVYAVEVDRTICELLKARMAHLSNVEVLCQDILTFAWARYPHSHIVGTIPYHITSPILVSLCEQSAQFAGAWLAIQQEVASRLAARPATKEYGRLSILVQYRFEVTPLLRIPRSAFFPQPQVESRWIHLSTRPAPPASVEDERLFFDVVRAAFAQRRKTLLNCLGTLARPRLDRDEAAEAIRQAGLPSGVRGEELSLSAFARLAKTIQNFKK